MPASHLAAGRGHEPHLTLSLEKRPTIGLLSQVVLARERPVEEEMLGENGLLRRHIRWTTPAPSLTKHEATLARCAMLPESLSQIARDADFQSNATARVNFVQARLRGQHRDFGESG